MSEETTFCCTHDRLHTCCGNTTVECDHGYVVDVVEVEKGDSAACTFCPCCDKTSLDSGWTDIIKGNCDGKRTCNASEVGEQKIRTVKIVYDCLQEPPTTRSTSTTKFDKTSIPQEETTQPHDPSSATSEPRGPSVVTGTTLSLSKSLSPNSQSQHGENPFPLVTTIAVSTITIAVIVIIIVVVLMCRKRKQNSQKNNTHPNKPCTGNSDVTGNENNIQLQPMESSQYENSGSTACREATKRDDDKFTNDSQSENKQYDHLGMICKDKKQKTENVYNVADFKGTDRNDDSVYNSSNCNDQAFSTDNEYDVANHATQSCARDIDYNIANHKEQVPSNDNDYNVAIQGTQNPVSENEYSYADEATPFLETVAENNQPQQEVERVELDHEYHIIAPTESQNPAIDNVYELVANK